MIYFEEQQTHLTFLLYVLMFGKSIVFPSTCYQSQLEGLTLSQLAHFSIENRPKNTHFSIDFHPQKLHFSKSAVRVKATRPAYRAGLDGFLYCLSLPIIFGKMIIPKRSSRSRPSSCRDRRLCCGERCRSGHALPLRGSRLR